MNILKSTVCFLVWQTSLCFNITSDFDAGSGIPLLALQDFESKVDTIGNTILDSWQETVAYPQLALGFLVASKSFPDSSEFEKFCAGNPYWNPRGVIGLTEWVPAVSNNLRSAFEKQARLIDQDFIIYSYTSSGPTERPQNYSEFYFPILYCSPPDPGLLGLDLNDDVEGPAILSAKSTGRPATSEPFDARDPSPDLDGFDKLMGLYMPLYHSNSSLVTVPNPDFAGCVVTIIAFHPMVTNQLAKLNIQNLDIFLFWIDPTPNGTFKATYVGHYESPPDATKPHISPANASTLQPGDITGDIVTNFVPSFNLSFYDRTFRYVVRARKGSIVPNVLVFGIRCMTSLTFLPVLTTVQSRLHLRTCCERPLWAGPTRSVSSWLNAPRCSRQGSDTGSGDLIRALCF